MARWGMPSSQKALYGRPHGARPAGSKPGARQVGFKELVRMEPDRGATNIRDVNNAHWRRSLGPAGRCLAPFHIVLPVRQSRRQEDVGLVRYRRKPAPALLRRFRTNWIGSRKAKEGEVAS